jgi:hypothetical protein
MAYYIISSSLLFSVKQTQTTKETEQTTEIETPLQAKRFFFIHSSSMPRV